MSEKPTPDQLELERARLTGIDAVLYELVRHHGDIKLCHSNRNGWVVEVSLGENSKEWGPLHNRIERSNSPTKAIEAARAEHNLEIALDERLNRPRRGQPIPEYRVHTEANGWRASTCEQEGWELFDVDSTGLMEIERDDEVDAFADDDEAVAYVRRRAESSEYHRKAIELHDRDAEELRKYREGEAPKREKSLAEALVRGQMREEFLAKISDTEQPIVPVEGRFYATIFGKVRVEKITDTGEIHVLFEDGKAGIMWASQLEGPIRVEEPRAPYFPLEFAEPYVTHDTGRRPADKINKLLGIVKELRAKTPEELEGLFGSGHLQRAKAILTRPLRVGTRLPCIRTEVKIADELPDTPPESIDENMQFIYAFDQAWPDIRPNADEWHIKVKEGRKVHKVRHAKLSRFAFEFVDEPGVVYNTNYGWSLVYDTPENVERLAAREEARVIAKQANAVVTEINKTITTLDRTPDKDSPDKARETHDDRTNAPTTRETGPPT